MEPNELLQDPAANPLLAPGLQAININKRFGSLIALKDVSMTVRPGTFHALLGGNGAGKSTLVKCIMGYYQPDSGEIIVGQRVEVIKNPKEALALGIGMVYQHFTLVGNMTVGENLVLSRGTIPFTINWEKERAELRKFLKTTPFFIPLDARVNDLAAGQKQKLEIVKQLYLKNKLLFLDEPTSVLTPQEADEVLTMLKNMTLAGKLSVLIITHKFSHVMKFADDFTVLRTGKLVGQGRVADYTPAQMAEMMIGNQTTATIAARSNGHVHTPQLTLEKLCANDDTGVEAFEDLAPRRPRRRSRRHRRRLRQRPVRTRSDPRRPAAGHLRHDRDQGKNLPRHPQRNCRPQSLLPPRRAIAQRLRRPHERGLEHVLP